MSDIVYSVEPKDNADMILKEAQSRIREHNPATAGLALTHYVTVLVEHIALLEANVQRMKEFTEGHINEWH